MMEQQIRNLYELTASTNYIVKLTVKSEDQNLQVIGPVSNNESNAKVPE